MARILLQVVLPFLLPFLAFFLWRLLVARGQRFLDNTPWYALAATGLALVSVSLVVLALIGGDPPGRYLPARLEGDRIVPGTVVPAGDTGLGGEDRGP